ncbi:SRPBCC family protein [Actinomycetospora lemnae]|uniref:SRPBCC family protein n=1 Tax=Actinomycetospora lemnae TaxID=3019891 RepID=A0ABT5SXG6_9PSEU|nr:SRPBCC family protein [Actinomycetospora sp. DW7H6]MDD7967479.1 SRPBCC family protein [Actinomycetospora sp. DW7H6]
MDVQHEISATRRTVGSRTLEAGEAALVTVSRAFPTDVDDLWCACTQADRIARWFLPVSGELRLGGRYQLEGNAGGTVTACDPPRGFDATWEFGGGVSWIEVRLDPEGAGDPAAARFTLTHIAHVDDDHWRTYGPGAAGIGWDLGLLGLGLHLGTGAGVSPEQAEAWSVSDEGRAFIAASGEAWAAASAEAGMPVDDAEARAARTVAFYTGAEV